MPVSKPINKNQASFVIISSQFRTARNPTIQVVEELKGHSVNGPQIAINCKNPKFQIQFQASEVSHTLSTYLKSVSSLHRTCCWLNTTQPATLIMCTKTMKSEISIFNNITCIVVHYTFLYILYNMMMTSQNMQLSVPCNNYMLCLMDNYWFLYPNSLNAHLLHTQSTCMLSCYKAISH